MQFNNMNSHIKFPVIFSRFLSTYNFRVVRNLNISNHNAEWNRVMSSSQIALPKKLEDQVDFWMKKYQDLFGLTKLDELHSKVLEVKDKIQDIQEKRRKVQQDIFLTQKKLQETHDVLHKLSIGDDMYISFITQVRDLLKEQKRLQEEFSMYDQTEREYQTNLALAINSSQDHERSHREKHKYLSIISGAVCGLFCFFASTLFNWFYRKNITSNFGTIRENITAIEDYLKSCANDISEDIKLTNNLSKQIEEMKTELVSQGQLFENTGKDIESRLNDKVFLKINSSDGMYVDMQIGQMLLNLEDSIDTKLRVNSVINTSLVSTLLIICGCLLYFSRSP